MYAYLHREFFVSDEAVEDVLEADLQVRVVSELNLTEMAHHPTGLERTYSRRGHTMGTVCTYVCVHATY